MSTESTEGREPEVFETVWPGCNFAQFGGHVMERLLRLHRELGTLGDKRFKVTVRIEVEEQLPVEEPAPGTRPLTPSSLWTHPR